MFILRKILKFMLSPIILVLFFIKWALAVSLKLSEIVMGLPLLLVGGGVIYSLIHKQWTDAFLFGLCYAGIIVILAVCTVVQSMCDNLLEKIIAL